jgi:hypothetical protein
MDCIITMSWFLSSPSFGKSGGKTDSTTHITKALAASQPIFKPKRSVLSSHDKFLKRDNKPIYTAVSVRDFNGEKGVKTIRQASSSPNIAATGLFLFRRASRQACGGGHPNH